MKDLAYRTSGGDRMLLGAVCNFHHLDDLTAPDIICVHAVLGYCRIVSP